MSKDEQHSLHLSAMIGWENKTITGKKCKGERRFTEILLLNINSLLTNSPRKEFLGVLEN